MKNNLSAEEAKWLWAVFDEPGKVTWTLPEQIANRIGEDIIRGILVPGQPLMELMLAETYFQVSRGPVREALRILESEGLVKIRPRRGAIVTELSVSNVKEIFDVRALLYGFVASELAINRTDEIISILQDGTKKVAAAFDHNNVDEFISALYYLSMYLPEVCGNSYAKNIIVSLGRRTLATTRKAMLEKENCRLWVSNWKCLVKAIEQRDTRAAEDAGRKLVHDVLKSTVKILEASQVETDAVNQSAAGERATDLNRYSSVHE